MKTSEEKQCHLRCWEMHQWGHHAPEPRSSWADILSEDMEGKEHCAVVIHHYGYLPARFVWFMHLVPVDSFGSGKCWHEILATSMRTHLAQNVNEQLPIEWKSQPQDQQTEYCLLILRLRFSWKILGCPEKMRVQGRGVWSSKIISLSLCHSKTSFEFTPFTVSCNLVGQMCMSPESAFCVLPWYSYTWIPPV